MGPRSPRQWTELMGIDTGTHFYVQGMLSIAFASHPQARNTHQYVPPSPHPDMVFK